MICSLEKSGRWKAILLGKKIVLKFIPWWNFFFNFEGVRESFNVNCEKDSL
jgi:hypothetical protein